MRTLTPNALGSIAMAFAGFAVTVNDALLRSITDDGPGPYQVLCMRSIAIAMLFFVVGCARGEYTLRAHLSRPLLVRTGAEVVGAACFYTALVRVEFANIQAIVQVIPLMVTLGAAVYLRERVTAARYITVVVGFIGVVVLVRPGTDAFTPWAFFALAAAVFATIREFATRRIPITTPLVSISFVTAVGLALLTATLSIPAGWEPLPPSAWLRMAGSVFVLSIGYMLSVYAVQISDLSVSAPFRYVPVLGAVAIGYWAFDETPDLLTWIGAAIIVVAGLVAIELERLAGVRRRLALIGPAARGGDGV
ncbi:MAG: DMT family transporter [Acidimicrobiales bacterium]|nr:DMT family transporter [Acidimicrobiales bacterium]